MYICPISPYPPMNESPRLILPRCPLHRPFRALRTGYPALGPPSTLPYPPTIPVPDYLYIIRNTRSDASSDMVSSNPRNPRLDGFLSWLIPGVFITGPHIARSRTLQAA